MCEFPVECTVKGTANGQNSGISRKNFKHILSNKNWIATEEGLLEAEKNNFSTRELIILFFSIQLLQWVWCVLYVTDTITQNRYCFPRRCCCILALASSHLPSCPGHDSTFFVFEVTEVSHVCDEPLGYSSSLRTIPAHLYEIQRWINVRYYCWFPLEHVIPREVK